jgi:hypothetical protein
MIAERRRQDEIRAGYSRIVWWLLDVVGSDDPRGFDPTPMFLFAYHYDLLEREPADIYLEYVHYQCAVYETAAALLSADQLNQLTFAELQVWFETNRNKPSS